MSTEESDYDQRQKREKLLNPSGSKTMPLPGLQIRLPVTLIFNLLTPKYIV